MKGPRDFEEELTPEDLVQVEELEKNLEEWFADPHDQAEYNLNVPDNARYPIRVWEECVRKAGWRVDYRGAIINVRRPRRA
jgi:hypothetical protein